MNEHTVAVIVNGKQIEGWSEYTIRTSIVDPVDTFQLTRPWHTGAWGLLVPDRPIRVLIDGVPVVTGFLDEREVPEDGETIQISGRDRCGRLVQESAPAIDYAGLGVRELVAKLAAPWFSRVTLSNARNRRVLRGKGTKASAPAEPVRIDSRVGTRIEPGQTRWAVIADLLAQAGYLAWSSGDGDELIVGRPNYDQAIQFRLARPAPGDVGGNVLGLGCKDSTADRYSRIVVTGSGVGSSARRGEAKDNPATADGEGRSFTAPKCLLLADQAVQSRAEADALAKREMARRDAGGHVVTARAPLHGQRVSGQALTLFCPDTLARVDDALTDIHASYLLATCTYRATRDGESTSLELVPRGTELST